MDEIIGTLSAAWKRQFVITNPGPPDLFAMYSDEALTGWALILQEPKIETFNNMKCVIIPLTSWIMAKTYASETVTPFRIVAKGKNLIEKPFRPHTGLKYAVRNTELGAGMLIPVEDFNVVKQ